ncbi:MAG TPA: hypothetical protein VG052_05590, partial [Puia sp.]|nr:hypothetical protein [Puia sp.]
RLIINVKNNKEKAVVIHSFFSLSDFPLFGTPYHPSTAPPRPATAPSPFAASAPPFTDLLLKITATLLRLPP